MDRQAGFFDRPGLVAVTGHRLNRMTPPVAARLLDICTETFRDAHPGCALLSCLADGTDLIAAQAWPGSRRLHSLLPVPLEQWRAILGPLVAPGVLDSVLARTTPEVLAAGDSPDYVALADAMVARCDRLFAVWDGAPGRPGGTGSVVARARAAGKPVLHLALVGERLAFADLPPVS